MRDVRLKLEAESVQEYRRHKKTQRIIEYANVAVLLGLSLPIAILGFFDTSEYQGAARTIMLAFLVLRGGSLIFVVVIYIIFMRLLVFFKRRRDQKIA